MWVIKRVYETPDPGDGERVLVERLWPRGKKKEDVPMDRWDKQVSPSNELRSWYHHDVARWEEFKKRYRAELEANPDAWRELLQDGLKHKVTLLFSASDVEHNSALVLKEFLEKQKKKKD